VKTLSLVQAEKNKDDTMIMITELNPYESLYSVKPETKKVPFESETEAESGSGKKAFLCIFWNF
jgi:hypothetical protein